MSHNTPRNQVQKIEAGMIVYSYLVTDYSKVMFEGQVNAMYKVEKHEALAVNGRMMVLNNDQFTRVNIDDTNYAGNNSLNNPFINLYFDDNYYGDGFLFSLYSDQLVSPAEIKKLISQGIARARKSLFDVNLSFIDNACNVGV